MDEQKQATLSVSTGRDRGRRGRRSAGTHPRKVVSVVRVEDAAEPAVSLPAGDRVHRETTLIGALQLVEEGLLAAEESYRRVLTVFEGTLGAGHPEVADVHRRLSVAERARGHRAEADFHARRAIEVERALGVVPLDQMAEAAVRGLT